MSGHQAALLGSAAGVLGSGILNVNRMRPWINSKGETRVATANGQSMRVNSPATLQYDEWKDIDRTVIEIAVQRLVGVKHLMEKGLVHNLGSIGQTVSLWESSSDMTPAAVSMEAGTRSEKDKVLYNQASVPVPIVHKDFTINARRLEASRLFGEGVDVTQASISARVVAEKLEDLLFLGTTAVKVGGSTIYGYTTHGDRNTVTLSMQWTNGSKTGALILADVQAMLAAARADHHFGPFCLYIPPGYEGKLDDDFNPGTSDTRTIRQRLLALEAIQEIKVVDRLTAHNVLLVQLTSDVVDMAIAQDITTVQWNEMGGLVNEFHVMAVMAPRIKSDYDGQSGIVHLS